jgi:hypothetical protein
MKNSVIVLLSNYYSDNQINKNDMVKASTHYAKEREVTDNNKKIVGNPEWKTSLGRPKCIQENNTEIHVLIKKHGVWVWSVFN